jgi:hypothetical protein
LQIKKGYECGRKNVAPELTYRGFFKSISKTNTHCHISIDVEIGDVLTVSGIATKNLPLWKN